MKHYWINIDKCTERKEYMEEQFLKENIDNIRVSAVTPETYYEYTIIRNPDSKESIEEICCLLSHMKVLQLGYDSGDQYFCVTEDDMIIPKLDCEKIISHMRQAEEKNNQKVELLQLYTSGTPFIWQMMHENVLVKEPIFVIPRKESCPGTVYYLISRIGAKKLLDKFKLDELSYDFSYSSWTAADNMLYSPIQTYILTYPITITNIKLGSIIHEQHLHHHENANQLIRQIHQKYPLLDYFI